MSSPDGESNLPLPFLLRSTHVGLAALSLVCSPGVVCWSGRNIVCALTSPSEFLARAIASVNSASHCDRVRNICLPCRLVEFHASERLALAPKTEPN